jgi:hypothetical protein
MNRREAIAALTALPSVSMIARADPAPDDVLVVECDGKIFALLSALLVWLVR